MANNDDLQLGGALIRKGQARGVDPALATAAPASPIAAQAPVVVAQPPQEQLAEDDDPPLRAAPPDDVPKRFTSFRLPVDLDEELRSMMFETRRSKQDLLIEFVTQGVQAWRRGRVKR